MVRDVSAAGRVDRKDVRVLWEYCLPETAVRDWGAAPATEPRPRPPPPRQKTIVLFNIGTTFALKKRKLLIDSDRPRKSPREHASTFAILSLLQQQQQHNRRRTISGGSSAPLNLPPPSPVPSTWVTVRRRRPSSSKCSRRQILRLGMRSGLRVEAIRLRKRTVSSGGIGAKRIKFDPPIMPEQSFVNYKVMCQQLDEFLDVPKRTLTSRKRFRRWRRRS